MPPSPKVFSAIHFRPDVTLGSVLTILIVLIMALEVWLFYDAVADRVQEARQYQIQNRASIEALSIDLSNYKIWSHSQALSLTKQLEALQKDIDNLKAEHLRMKNSRS